MKRTGSGDGAVSRPDQRFAGFSIDASVQPWRLVWWIRTGRIELRLSQAGRGPTGCAIGKLGIRQVRACEMRTRHVGVIKKHTTQTRSIEARVRQVGFHEKSTAQDHLRERRETNYRLTFVSHVWVHFSPRSEW